MHFGVMMEGKAVIGLWACMENLKEMREDLKGVNSGVYGMKVDYLKLIVYFGVILEDFGGRMFVGVRRPQSNTERSEVIFQDFRDTVVSTGVVL